VNTPFVSLLSLGLTLLLCSLPPAVFAGIAESNTYLVVSIADESGYENAYYRSRLLHRERIPEILPASQDTNGNWGLPTDGLQLSVRFRRHGFVQKEPVAAVIILRNLNSQPRDMWSYNIPTEVTLRHGTNTSTWTRPKPNIPVDDPPGHPYRLEGKSEELTTARLDRLFNLEQPGEYSVQVRATQLRSNGPGTTNVVSGVATFRIEETLSP
jgi:hypothetical protein